MLLFGVVLIYICVSIVLTGMSYRRQGTLSLAARDSLRKIIIAEPELSTLSPVNTSLRDFQQTRTTLPSTFSKRENSRDRPMQNEKELDQPSLDDSKLPSSTQEDISSAEDVSDQSDSNSTTTTFLFQESYGILVDAVPSAILVSLSPDISVSSTRVIITSLLPDESAWFTREYSFSRDQWFCFPPFFTSREPAYQSFLSSLQQHYLASYTLFYSLNHSSESKRNSSNENARHASYSKYQIRFIKGSNSPFVDAHNICIDSSRVWSFFFEGGGFRYRYPSKQSSFPRECNTQASAGNTNSMWCIKRFQTRPRGSKTDTFSCLSRTYLDTSDTSLSPLTRRC